MGGFFCSPCLRRRFGLRKKLPAMVRWLARTSTVCASCDNRGKGGVLIIGRERGTRQLMTVCYGCLSEIDRNTVVMLIALIGKGPSGKRVYGIQVRIEKILQEIRCPPWIKIPVTWRGSFEKKAVPAEVIQINPGSNKNSCLE